jgi:hypothetical protein
MSEKLQLILGLACLVVGGVGIGLLAAYGERWTYLRRERKRRSQSEAARRRGWR